MNTQIPSHGNNTRGKPIRTRLRGMSLLERPLLNKGTAFDETERLELGLLGLLPPDFENLQQQAARAYRAYSFCETDIRRHINLRALQDNNETLFYRLVLDHLEEMMPIIYTPTVGLACQRFSNIYRRPRGLFIPYLHRNRMEQMLNNTRRQNVRVIVVTDGERILGLGDQGAGGMGISIGKLSLYTACGGIDPATTLPIFLDAGTCNEELLQDPRYLGWRHERIRGDEYYDFVDIFIAAIKKLFPNALLQFEDFAQVNAIPLLERYRDQLCTFNDDIQGTAAVTAGTLLSASKVTGRRLSEHAICFLGSGSAGCGIAEQIVRVMMEEGLSERDARSHIFMVDQHGLLLQDTPDLLPFQKPLAQDSGRCGDWKLSVPNRIELPDVVRNARISTLIGVCGQPGLFTEEIVRAMAENQPQPIIMPLSNPTSQAEATPKDVLHWSEGRALVATGSPFAPVEFNNKRFPIAQCNNSYIFPGIGLGVLSCGATRLSEGMLVTAARTLAKNSPTAQGGDALLPALEQVRDLSLEIAQAVALCAQQEGHAPRMDAGQTREQIHAHFWSPLYHPVRAAS